MNLRSKTGNSQVKGMFIFAVCALGSLGVLIMSDQALNNAFSVGFGYIDKIQNSKNVIIKDLRVSTIKQIANIDTNAWPVETNLIKFKAVKKTVKVIKPKNIQKPMIKASNAFVLNDNKINISVKDHTELKTQISKDDIARIEEHTRNVESVLGNDKSVREEMKEKIIRPIVVTHIIVSKDRAMQLYGADINTEHTALVKTRYAREDTPKKEVATIPNTKYFKREVIQNNDN